jgi:hypothetical protein
MRQPAAARSAGVSCRSSRPGFCDTPRLGGGSVSLRMKEAQRRLESRCPATAGARAQPSGRGDAKRRFGAQTMSGSRGTSTLGRICPSRCRIESTDYLPYGKAAIRRPPRRLIGRRTRPASGYTLAPGVGGSISSGSGGARRHIETLRSIVSRGTSTIGRTRPRGAESRPPTTCRDGKAAMRQSRRLFDRCAYPLGRGSWVRGRREAAVLHDAHSSSTRGQMLSDRGRHDEISVSHAPCPPWLSNAMSIRSALVV